MSDLDRGHLPPGAEYAPVVPIGVRPSTLGDWEQVERRLSVRDPDDQRAIWRRAAMALGLSPDSALCAVLARSRGMLRTSDGLALWSLRDLDGKPIASVWVSEDTVESATAALCARVWGPR